MPRIKRKKAYDRISQTVICTACQGIVTWSKDETGSWHLREADGFPHLCNNAPTRIKQKAKFETHRRR